MSILSALQNVTTANGQTEVERRIAEAEQADAFAARSAATAPTHDLLADAEQAALNTVVAGLAERGTDLRGYQHAAVETILSYRRIVLGFAPGLGKTLTTVAAWAAEKQAGAEGTLLVVCPPHLRLNWLGDIRKHFGDTLTATSVTGTREGQIPTGFDIVVIADSILTARTDDLVASISDGTVRGIVFDESQRFKNNRFKTKRSHAALLISHHLHNVYGGAIVVSATGTLVGNFPADVLQPVALCGPEVTKRLSGSGGWDPEIGCVGYSSFQTRWSSGTYKRLPNGNVVLDKVTGCKDPKALNGELVAACYIWVDRYEVTDLPPMVYAQQVIDNTADFGPVRPIHTNFLAWVEEQHGLAAAQRASRAIQLTQLNALRKAEGMATVGTTADIVADLVQQGEQVVVFAFHREVVASLAGSFTRSGIKTNTIVGGMTAQAKRDAQHAYQNGDVQVIICNYDAASTGIDLDSPTSKTVVFHQLPYTPSTFVQASGRVERLGQQRGCVGIIPVATDAQTGLTFTERLASILSTKVAVADAVNNGGQHDTLGNTTASVEDALLASFGLGDYG